MIETNSLVVFEPKCSPEEWERAKIFSPFLFGEVVLFLGEIKQMPDHCIVVQYNGKIIWGIHTNNFRLATEDDI